MSDAKERILPRNGAGAEKSLRHVVMVVKFLDKPKTRHFKSEFTLFQIHRPYSISFNLSNVGEIFWG